MRGVCDFTDFFVIATGRNTRQTKAIYDEVAGVLKQEHRLLPRSSAGAAEADWIVADYLDVVLHLFTPDTRRLLPARGALVGRSVRRGRGGGRRLDWGVLGAVAQLGERLAGSQKVRGSSPLGSIGQVGTARR